MDFASQLQNLEKRAATAASRSSDSTDRRRDRSPDPRGGGYNNGNRNQRPRYNNYNTNNQRSRQGPHQHYRQSYAPHRSPLEAMKRYGYNVTPPPEFFAPINKKDRTAEPPHLCLLAITIDDLPFEHVWRAWASSLESSTDSPCYVSLVCHAKFPDKVQSEWLRQRLLLEPPRMGRGKTYDDPVFLSYTPAWGSVQITRAMRDCLVTASKIGTNTGKGISSIIPPEQQKQHGRSKEAAVGGASEARKKPEEIDPRFDPNRFVISKPPLAANDDDKTIPPVDKFIFISETCLPVRTLSECREVLFPAPPSSTAAAKPENDDSVKNGDEKDAADEEKEVTATATSTTTVQVDPWDVSWVNARNRNMEGTPRNLYERDQFGKIHRMVPGMCRWKADQWIILSRKHALAVLHIDSHMPTKDELWNAFADVNASDEMYFPTALAVLGILQEDGDINSNSSSNAPAPPRSETSSGFDSRRDSGGRDAADEREPRQKPNPNEVVKRPVTYTDWSEGMRNPTSFSGLRDFIKVATAARQRGCLMARKFVVAGDGESISVDEWTGVMEKMNASEREKKDQ